MLPLLFISFLCPGRVLLAVIGDRFVFSSSSLEQKLSLPLAAGGEVVGSKGLGGQSPVWRFLTFPCTILSQEQHLVPLPKFIWAAFT